MINKKRLVKTFIKLVKIYSPSRSEREVSEFIKKELAGLRIKSVYDNAGKYIAGNCGNLYAKIKGNVMGAPSILLNAHMDTVTAKHKIHPIIKNGIISSNGQTILGADCKAGIAAIFEAIKILEEDNIPHGEIIICFTIAEEIGLLGAKYADSKLLKADIGLVIDGGDVDKIINRAPKQLSLEAKIVGRAAHAGVHPEQGINAIKVASFAITKMKLGRIDQETTANIGIICGGVATNIVPEEVIIKGEARSHNKKKLKRQINNITKALTYACRKYRASIRLKVDPMYESFNLSEKSKIVQIVKDAAKKINIRPKICPTGGGSDANIFNENGIDCVILGVGGNNVHTNKENIAVKDLVKGTELILAIIKDTVVLKNKNGK